MYKYRFHSITVESEIELPEIPLNTNADSDVRIKYGSVPESHSKMKKSKSFYEASPNDFLMRLESVGGYRVKNGNEIIVDPQKNSKPEEVRLFLMGSALGALLHQRGLYPLHGSTIKTKNGAIVFVGDTGSGKSTIVAGLLKKGYKVLTDDITVINTFDNGDFIVHPGTPFLRLWKDVLNYFNYAIDLKNIRPNTEKYIRPLVDHFYDHPLHLHAIIALSSKDSPECSIHESGGFKKYRLLYNNTYRLQFINGLGKTKDHFIFLSKLSERTSVYELKRPSKSMSINEFIEYFDDKLLKAD